MGARLIFAYDSSVARDMKEGSYKIETMDKYESQVERRGYFQINAVKSVMGYQGHHIGAPCAEDFVWQRGVI